MDASRGQGVAGRKHSSAESQESLAESYLRCGAVQQYCELMTRLHQWDHALALAPAVSVDYWRKLMARYELLLSSFSIFLLVFCVDLISKFHQKLLLFGEQHFGSLKKN